VGLTVTGVRQALGRCRTLVPMKTYELLACPGCGSAAASEFPYGAATPLRRCQSCNLVYASAFADPEEVYIDGYLTGGTDFGLDIFHPLFQQLLFYISDRRLRLTERVTGVGSMLDVGCGSGEVLAVARDRGWTVTGCEPVEESAAYAREQRGLDVRTALLQESGLPERSYDVVVANHVLEHMNDGQGFLRLIARWAKPGGYVAIEVPNWRSFHRRGFGFGWPGLRPLEHVAHYTPTTLRSTFRNAGLEPVKIHTPTYLWHKQTLDQQLADLGRMRWMRWLKPLGRDGVQCDKPAVMPTAPASAILRATAQIFSLTHTGYAVVGIARVP